MRRHPIWDILDHQGRSLQWLSRRARYSESHIWAIKGGRAPASAEFRARCADALDLPDSVLFHDGSSASRPASTPETAPITRAETAGEDALYQPVGGAA